MSDSTAAGNQGAPNEQDMRQKIERVVRDELARLRASPCDERHRPIELQPAPSILTRLRANMSIFWTAVVTEFTGRKPWKNWTKEDEKLPDSLAKELFRENLTALCLSGGGIRSASFCLGILQALARQKLLSQFDYLSTVSGGGYIGSWLSAWRSRDGQNIAAIEKALSNSRLESEDRGETEPREVINLRDFTSYLTPRRGLMSSDTWAGAATLCRNLALNWMAVPAPCIVACMDSENHRTDSTGGPIRARSERWPAIGASRLGFLALNGICRGTLFLVRTVH
jgi:Patatin-like phospholipase